MFSDFPIKTESLLTREILAVMTRSNVHTSLKGKILYLLVGGRESKKNLIHLRAEYFELAV